MIRHFASVSGFTLLSRLSGFVRDVLLASIMGSGLIADAYFIAQRLPNHFRAIFGEGAFNSAFVPAYTRELEERGEDASRRLAGSILSALTLILVVLSAVAMWQMPFVIDLLAPGFSNEPEKYALAVTLTRITFPYLLFVSLVTLISGILNAHHHFASAAAAPILLNLAIIAALACAFLFPSAAHAAAWGIAISGVLQLALVAVNAKRANCLPRFVWPEHSASLKRFLRALGPAVIGSAGVQIAIFADTIIASLLPTGAVSAISYADRLYQLPLGLIGIAAGTVLLPEMSRHLGRNDHATAHAAQNRSMALTILLTMPFFVAFLSIPEEIMRGVFMHGRYTAEDASASALVLAAYGIGILPVVLIRSLVASFHARQDTMTPLIAAFIGIAINVVLKIALYQSWGASGLAFATAIGAWVNGGLLALLAYRKSWFAPDQHLTRLMIATVIAALILAAVTPSLKIISSSMTATLPMSAALLLIALGLSGGAVYALSVGIAARLLKAPLPLRLR
jgi:putative peptidoglycan lipid II flippase